MEQVELIRHSEGQDSTFGILVHNNNVIAKTLELKYKGNMQNISSIPEGIYIVVPRMSKKFGDHFEITSVPNRSLILFHAGNTIADTKGCILVGDPKKIGSANSRATLNKMVKLFKSTFQLVIINSY